MDGDDDITCSLNIATDTKGSYPPQWIIVGEQFFKDFVIVIDQDAQNFSFGLSKSANEGAKIEGPPSPDPPVP